MTIDIIDGIRTLQLDMIATVALAGLLLLLGYAVRSKATILEKMAIPAPVIGGVICALVIWLLRDTGWAQVKMDTTLQLPFMLAFFTCIGFGGSFAILRKGGRYLIVFLAACWVLSIIQGAVGVGLASMLNIHPVLGVMAGPVSLVGGHGNAAAFGPVAENIGVAGATTVAIASATFGLVVGSLTGGPVGDYLIRKFRVPIETDQIAEVEEAEQAQNNAAPITAKQFIIHLTIVFVFMFGGMMFANWISNLGIDNFALPTYVGAMLLAITFRNINDGMRLIQFDQRIIDLILEIGLGFFLSMAIMALQIWQLVSLAIPMLVILVTQFIVLLAFSRFVLFPIIGKTYDGAVMIGGFSGWGMGIAATAVVCMSAICEKYQLRSTKAFLIAPLCGAVFVDIVSVPVILYLINAFAS